MAKKIHIATAWRSHYTPYVDCQLKESASDIEKILSNVLTLHPAVNPRNGWLIVFFEKNTWAVAPEEADKLLSIIGHPAAGMYTQEIARDRHFRMYSSAANLRLPKK